MCLYRFLGFLAAKSIRKYEKNIVVLQNKGAPEGDNNENKKILLEIEQDFSDYALSIMNYAVI